MPSIIKQAKRGLRRRSGEVLHSALHASPDWLRSRFAPALCYAEMLLFDYGIARIFYNNRHRISKDAWRSAQPAPHHVAWMARRGIKTVVNLRGEQTYGTRWLEQRACALHGLKLVDMKLKSRALPKRADFLAIRKLLAEAEYPILVHCKSGADRAGLMSVLIRHERDGAPIKDAMNQLSLRFGHFRNADTGVLDAVFDRFLDDSARTGIGFWDWIEKVYDPTEIERSFHAKGWANRIVNGILNRE